jgi:hypothetical protein
MLLRSQGLMHFHACPLTDDDPRFDTGTTLAASLATRVVPDHARCARCRDPGVDYAGTGFSL